VVYATDGGVHHQQAPPRCATFGLDDQGAQATQNAILSTTQMTYHL
jgi:hypothetical protein